jgi:hypothetical protein
VTAHPTVGWRPGSTSAIRHVRRITGITRMSERPVIDMDGQAVLVPTYGRMKDRGGSSRRVSDKIALAGEPGRGGHWSRLSYDSTNTPRVSRVQQVWLGSICPSVVLAMLRAR